MTGKARNEYLGSQDHAIHRRMARCGSCVGAIHVGVVYGALNEALRTRAATLRILMCIIDPAYTGRVGDPNLGTCVSVAIIICNLILSTSNGAKAPAATPQTANDVAVLTHLLLAFRLTSAFVLGPGRFSPQCARGVPVSAPRPTRLAPNYFAQPWVPEQLPTFRVCLAAVSAFLPVTPLAP